MIGKITATVEIDYGDNDIRKVEVSINRSDLTIDEWMEQIIYPLLQGHGFLKETIDKHLIPGS